MRIKTGFHLGLLGGGLLVVAAVASVGYSQLQIAETVAQNEALEAVAASGVEVVQLTGEVLLYGETRAVQQWRTKRDEMNRLLPSVEGDAGSRKFVGRIGVYLSDMSRLFDSLMASDAAKGAALAPDVKKILTSQLFQKNLLLQSELRALKNAADVAQRESYAQSKKRMLLIFGTFAGLIALFAAALSLLFRKIVLQPLQSLENAIRLVNAGNRALRAKVFAEDEIGVVCNTFNGLLDQQEQSRREIEFLAYHDVLTGLPNQLLVKDRLQHAIAFAGRSGARVALFFLDLDNFKTINDSLGHPVGDALLKAVAERLRACVRETDTISRQGGDEFLITLPEVVDLDAVTAFAEKLLEKLATSFDIDGHELATSVSIGIALYPDDSQDFDTLLKKADTAMYEAKDAGRNTYRFFTEQMNLDSSEYLRIRNGLRRALTNSEFVLYYQPQIDLASGAVIGAEALIRWKHPELGMVPPARFIPIAEDSGLIVPIGEWVLREACWQVAAWQSAGLPPLTVAVNLSAVQFKRGNVERTVTDALKDAAIDPALLELELTESILIKDTESVLTTVQQLKALGVKLSIDDFGTGYSSLSYLKRFNVDKLKIDQSFIRDLATDPEDEAIVRAVIQMAHSLNLRTVAEGVENADVLERLRRHDCDEAQGYHFARPLPAVEFERHVIAALAAG